MKKPLLPIMRLWIGLAGISFASLLTAQPSFAQLGKADAGGNNSDSQNNNLNFDSGNFNMFDLIHRANFGNTTFDPNRQNEQIDEAATRFRARQNQVNTNQKQGQQGQVLQTLPIIKIPSGIESTVKYPELTIPNKN